MVSKWEKSKQWIMDRFGLEPLKKHVLDRKVPRTPWYYGDGASLLILFGVLAATGAVMALTYSPSPDSAYQSVLYITNEAPLGWLVRALHYWAAGMMMVMIFFHFFRVILVGGYKTPREGTWIVGVFLLFAVFVMGFTGYLLRWDERAIYATTLVLHMFKKAPVIGYWIVVFVQGGEELGARTLTRMYAVHVIWMPALMGLLVAFHLYLVIKKGVTAPGEREQPVRTAAEQQALYEKDKEERGEVFYPETAAKSGLMGLVVFLIVAGLAFFAGPLPMYPEANLVEPTIPEEEWWYWWYSALIAAVPSIVAPWMVVFFPPLLFVALILLPLLDHNPHRQLKRRPFIAVTIFLSILILLWASMLRARSPWTAWPEEALPPVPEGIVLTPEAEAGRSAYTRYGCNSCHAIEGVGPEVGPELSAVARRFTREQMIVWIVAPPPTSSMPLDYGQRMTPQEIHQVVEYLIQIAGSRSVSPPLTAPRPSAAGAQDQAGP